MNEQIKDADFVTLLDDMWEESTITAADGPRMLKYLTAAVALVGRVLVDIRDGQGS